MSAPVSRMHTRSSSRSSCVNSNTRSTVTCPVALCDVKSTGHRRVAPPLKCSALPPTASQKAPVSFPSGTTATSRVSPCAFAREGQKCGVNAGAREHADADNTIPKCYRHHPSTGAERINATATARRLLSTAAESTHPQSLGQVRGRLALAVARELSLPHKNGRGRCDDGTMPRVEVPGAYLDLYRTHAGVLHARHSRLAEDAAAFFCRVAHVEHHRSVRVVAATTAAEGHHDSAPQLRKVRRLLRLHDADLRRLPAELLVVELDRPQRRRALLRDAAVAPLPIVDDGLVRALRPVHVLDDKAVAAEEDAPEAVRVPRELKVVDAPYFRRPRRRDVLAAQHVVLLDRVRV
eukprot:Opistho-1_new@96933